MEILWKGFRMKRSFVEKALSLALAALLSCSLTPAFALESSDSSEEADAAQPARAEQKPTCGDLSAEPETPENESTAKTDDSGEQVSDDAPGVVADGQDDGENDSDSPDNPAGEPGEDNASESDGAAPLAEGTYLVRSFLSNDKVLDVAGGSVENGANVQLYTSNMTAAQRFSVTVDEAGYYTFTNVASGKVLDVLGGLAESGTNVQQYESNGSDAQKWQLAEQADGSFVIQSKLDPALVLDVAGGDASDGANVQLYAANGTSAQSFALIAVNPDVPSPEPVDPGTYMLQSALGESLFLGISEQSRDDGVEAGLVSAGAGAARCFIVTVDENGFATLRSVNSGKVLDVDGGNLVPGTRVQQWTSEDNNNQKWAFQANVDGSWTVISKSNGLALDVEGAWASEGARVDTYTPNGTLAQRWHLVPAERVLENGLYTFASSLSSGLVVDVKDASTAEGASVQVWSRNNSPAQKFQLTWSSYNRDDDIDASVEVEGEEGSTGQHVEAWAMTIRPMTATGQLLTAWDDGNVSLVQPDPDNAERQLWIPLVAEGGGVTFLNVATELVLDVSGAGAYDGCPVGAYEQNGTAAQTFFVDAVDPIDAGTYVVQSLADGRALDVDGASRSNHANVQAWTLNWSGAQVWSIESAGGGYSRIINARSGKALDVVDCRAESGTNVQQYVWNGSEAQLWRVETNADGSYSLVSACGDLALDVDGGGGYDGANVQIYEPNGTAAQKWRLTPTTYVPQDFEDLIGSFTTYSQNTWNGTYNMQRALDRFDGIVLQPGESMSFYGVTGRCGAAEGYLPAGVVGGIGYGGGICQASTTIYGAAIRAGFEIVDRQNHSVPSVYVPIGLDAMVSWGYSDLVVRNTTGYPVKIRTYTYDNVLTCEFWGIQADWYDYIEPISWYTSSSSAAAQRVYYKDGAAVLTEWLPSSYYW